SALSSSSISHNIETQMQVLSTPELLADAYRAAGLAPLDSRVNVGINQAEKDVDIIELTTEAHSPEVAQKVTESLMDLYIAKDNENRYGDLKQAIKYAENQENVASNQWLNAAVARQNFQDKAGVVNYDMQVAAVTQTKQGLEDNLHQYQT